MATIELSGKVTNEKATDLEGLTVELWTAANWETPGAATATTTTDSDGRWFFNAAADNDYIVRVYNAEKTKSFLFDGRNEVQFTYVDIRAGATFNTARELLAKGGDLASASAITPGADGNYFDITGTTTITSIASLQAGTVVVFQFDGAVLLTHNSTSLILQGGVNFTTAAGDIVAFISEGSGNWRELNRRVAAVVGADHALADHSTEAHSELSGVGAGDHHAKYLDSEAITAVQGEATLDLTGRLSLDKGADLASGSTVTPGTDGNFFDITGTTTITAIASLRAGTIVVFQFDGILTLTHNSTSLILQGSTDLTTAVGDMVAFVSEGSGNWRELYRRLASALKLDDLATPDDNTDLDATTSLHGLLLKLGGGTTNFLRADGTWNAPVVSLQSVFYPGNEFGTVGTITFQARGDFFAPFLDDGTDEGIHVGGFFNAAPTAVKILLQPGGSGSSRELRYSVTTDFGADGEDYNANSDSIASVTSGSVGTGGSGLFIIDLIAAFTAAAANDYFGMIFNRIGSHAEDTIGSSVYVFGVLVEY